MAYTETKGSGKIRWSWATKGELMKQVWRPHLTGFIFWRRVINKFITNLTGDPGGPIAPFPPCMPSLPYIIQTRLPSRCISIRHMKNYTAYQENRKLTLVMQLTRKSGFCKNQLQEIKSILFQFYCAHISPLYRNTKKESGRMRFVAHISANVTVL